MPGKVVIISGATATGKTDISIKLSKSFGGEVVNFDSLLLYRELNIGTAKPGVEERQQVPHHLIDITSISSPLNAADYSRLAKPLIEKLLAEEKTVYLTGGSGFYLQALLKGMYDSPTTPEIILKRSEELYHSKGIDPFQAILQEHDKPSYFRYHRNDHYRIRRAVEHLWTTGRPLSEERQKKDSENKNLNTGSIYNWDMLHLYLELPREEHQSIIENRTTRMLERGLLDEIEQILASGFSGLEKPLQCIGYKEALQLKAGVIKNLSECRDKIVISTRQLAKAQRTWFHRINPKFTFHPIIQAKEIFQKTESFLKTNV